MLSVRSASLGSVALLCCRLGAGFTKGRVDEGGFASEGGDVCIEPHLDSNKTDQTLLYHFDMEESVVEEYMNNSTIPWRDPDGTYTMVTFYLPYCDGCKKQKEPYQALSRKVKDLIPDAIPFRSIAVSCHSKAHKSLCREDESIISFPTIRLYSGEGQSLPFLPNNQMHPFSVLQRLGITQTRLYSLTKQAPENYLAESATMRLLIDYDSMIARRHEQMLIALSILLRNVYEKHKDIAANERDPPLPEKVGEVVLDFLRLLEQTLPRGTPLHDTVHELLQNYVYIRKHQSWLQVILDEHTSDEGVRSDDNDNGNEKTVKKKFLSEIQYWDAIWDLLLTIGQGVAEWNAVAVTDDTHISTTDVRRVLEQFTLHAGWSEPSMAGQRDDFKWIEMLGSHQAADYLSLEEQGVSQHRALTLWLADLRSQWDLYVAVRHNHNWLDAGWPFRQVCEVCWERSRNKNMNRMSPYQWNEENVYDFVRLEYSTAHLPPNEIVRLHEQLRGNA